MRIGHRSLENEVVEHRRSCAGNNRLAPGSCGVLARSFQYGFNRDVSILRLGVMVRRWHTAIKV